MENQQLIEAAQQILGKFFLDDIEKNHAGHVACALLTSQGNIYTGISAELRCGVGFCAETGAIADMLKNREKEIKTIVAINRHGNFITPCGRCREMLVQVSRKNLETKILLSPETSKPLKELLPDLWMDRY